MKRPRRKSYSDCRQRALARAQARKPPSRARRDSATSNTGTPPAFSRRVFALLRRDAIFDRATSSCTAVVQCRVGNISTTIICVPISLGTQGRAALREAREPTRAVIPLGRDASGAAPFWLAALRARACLASARARPGAGQERDRPRRLARRRAPAQARHARAGEAPLRHRQRLSALPLFRRGGRCSPASMSISPRPFARRSRSSARSRPSTGTRSSPVSTRARPTPPSPRSASAPESLEKADFTSRYYATPARFIAQKDERAQGHPPRDA